MIAIIALLLCSIAVWNCEAQRQSLNTYVLNAETDLKLQWHVDDASATVRFALENPFYMDRKYFVFGFTKWGRLTKYDRVQIYHFNGVLKVVDQHVDANGMVRTDSQQDWTAMDLGSNVVGLERKIDTCDPEDLQIHNGTMHVHWERSETASGSTFQFHRRSSTDTNTTTAQHQHGGSGAGAASVLNGTVTVQLLRPVPVVPELDTLTLDMRVNEHPVSADNVYHCKIIQVPEFRTHRRHLVHFEPILTHPGLMHHMELFHCAGSDAVPAYEGDCSAPAAAAIVQRCARVVALWALGSTGFTYPPEAGVPLGGAGFNPYFRLEVHYNNWSNRTGLVDNSGLRLQLVNQLRRYDVGIMELGLEYTDKMIVPPGQKAFPLSGYCSTGCTRAALPDGGITVFGAQLHTHMHGVRVLTRQFRDGREIGTLGRDDYYTHEFQEIRNLAEPVQVLPGDDLITTCYYNTDARTGLLPGGFTAQDEMCVNYVHYYPATDLEVCKSSVGEKALYDFFEWHRTEEKNAAVVPDGPRSQNFEAIDWTKARNVELLYSLYMHAPLSMQCNRSDGLRFDGNWEGVPPVVYDARVKRAYPVPTELCPGYNPYAMQPLDQGVCGFMHDCVY